MKDASDMQDERKDDYRQAFNSSLDSINFNIKRKLHTSHKILKKPNIKESISSNKRTMADEK